MTDEDWNENRKFVLAGLARLDETHKNLILQMNEHSASLSHKVDVFHNEVMSKIETLTEDVNSLKVKARTWGAVFGTIAGIVGALADSIWNSFRH